MFRAALGADLLTFRAAPGVLFYLVYMPPESWCSCCRRRRAIGRMTVLYGALFGLFTYGTYDLTNYATIKPWTLASLASADIAWGMVVTAASVDLGHAGRPRRS